MIRTTLLAAASASLLSVSAFAAGPVLVDEAYSPHVVYDAPSANIVGSAHARVTGTPSTTNYETLRVFRTQAPPASYDFGVTQPWQIEVDSSN